MHKLFMSDPVEDTDPPVDETGHGNPPPPPPDKNP